MRTFATAAFILFALQAALAHPSYPKPQAAAPVMCPDSTSCGTGCKCCPQSSGGYACCQNDVVWCSDHNHYCKAGTTCCHEGSTEEDYFCCTGIHAVCCPTGRKCCYRRWKCNANNECEPPFDGIQQVSALLGVGAMAAHRVCYECDHADTTMSN